MSFFTMLDVLKTWIMKSQQQIGLMTLTVYALSSNLNSYICCCDCDCFSVIKSVYFY